MASASLSGVGKLPQPSGYYSEAGDKPLSRGMAWVDDPRPQQIPTVYPAFTTSAHRSREADRPARPSFRPAYLRLGTDDPIRFVLSIHQPTQNAPRCPNSARRPVAPHLRRARERPFVGGRGPRRHASVAITGRSGAISPSANHAPTACLMAKIAALERDAVGGESVGFSRSVGWCSEGILLTRDQTIATLREATSS